MSAQDPASAPAAEARDGSAQRSGRRALRESLLEEDSYGWLLILLLLDIVLLTLLPSSAFARFVLVVVGAAVMVLGLHTSRVRPRTLRIAIGVAIASVLLALVALLTGSTELDGVTYLLLMLLMLVTPPLILKRVLTARSVTLRTVIGAICVYVMLALIFCFLYLAVNRLSGSPFFAQGPNHSVPDYLYFSLITLTTVGYGDLSAAGHFGRLLASMEALFAQIYLVTTVARMVSAFSGPSSFQRGGQGSSGDP